MCNSISGNCCCCPPALVFTEQFCGNFNETNDIFHWVAASGVDDYIQGTFEISVTTGRAAGLVFSSTTPGFIGTDNTTEGNSSSVSVDNPISFFVSVTPGTTGKFCITLEKRVIG